MRSPYPWILAGMLACLIMACAAPVTPSPGPGPAPSPSPAPAAMFRLVGTLNGRLDVGAELAGIPVLSLLKVEGQGKVTIQSAIPFLKTDGDIVVTPLPGHEAGAQKAVDLGHVVIIRGGQEVGLTFDTAPAVVMPAPPPETSPPSYP